MLAKAEIPALTGLRGLAALWVFAYHAHQFSKSHDASNTLNLLGGAGYLGVDVFFVLSGFVLAFNYADRGIHHSAREWASFLWKRLARIYPVHLAALALLAALLLLLVALDTPFARPKLITAGGLVQSLLLTHGWTMLIRSTWNWPSWSVSCEWAAYLAFPLIAAMACRVRSRTLAAWMILLLFLALCSQIKYGQHRGSMEYGIVRVAAGFSAGVLLHRIYELTGSLRDRLRFRWDVVALSALLVMVIGGNLAAANFGRFAPLPYLPVSACLVVYGLAQARGPFQRLLSGPACQYAGRISYSFYMTHGIALLAARSFVMDAGLMQEGRTVVLTIAAAFVVAVLLAHWFYHSIEQPARRAMLAKRKGAGGISATVWNGRDERI